MRVVVSQENSHEPPGPKHGTPPQPQSASANSVPNYSFRNKISCACGGGCPTCEQINHDSAGSESEHAAPVPAGASEILARQNAESLPASVKTAAEQRFGLPFEGTRIHVGPEAHRLTRAAGAHAFTLGRDIVFGAGQYAPESAHHNPLLWHELGHAAGPSRPGRILRAPIYDNTQYKLPPLPRGHTAKSMADDLEKKKNKKPPDITGWHIKGAPAGSEAEIFLEYAIWSLARPDRWDRVMKFDTEIGWPVKGFAPPGQIQLTIDDKGDATAELIQSGFLAWYLPFTEAEAIAKLKGPEFGAAGIEKGDKDWSVDDLNDVMMSLSLLPAGDKAALKGVTFVRVKKLPKDYAGQFSSGGGVAMGATTVTARAELKLADGAFESGRRFVGTAGSVFPASYQTIAHEAGHAVEKQLTRQAKEDLEKVIIQQNISSQAAEAARKKWKEAFDKGLPVAAHKAEFDKQIALNKAAVALAALKRTALGKTQVATSLVQPLETDAKTKQATAAASLVTADTAAKGFAPAELTESDSYRTNITAVAKLLDAYAKDSLPGSGKSLEGLDDALILAIKTRDAERAHLTTKFPSNPAIAAYQAVEQAQDAAFDAARTLAHTRGRSLRLQKFVDVVNANKITPFTK